MESSVFVSRPQLPPNIKIVSWNINSVCTKLEKANVDNMLRCYDIVALSEVKTTLPVHLPGYVSYRGKRIGSSERGGMVLLVKNHLCNYIQNIDLSIGDQIWVQLGILEDVLVGFCYVPPHDSQYYSNDAFASIQEKVMCHHMRNGVMIIGDMNARFGKAVRDLVEMYDLANMNISYPIIEDDVNAMNDNAELLSAICVENNMCVLNNLKTQHRHYVSSKTYRKRNIWVSELDTCVVSPCLLEHIHEFTVIKRADLPSDHAPITVSIANPGTHVDTLLARADFLGDHAVLYGSATKCKVARKPVKFINIDRNKFVANIACTDMPMVNDDINIFAQNVSDVLYGCVDNSRSVVVEDEGDVHLNRWERLLGDADDARVWKAISWKGDFESTNSNRANVPSDEEFKVHFEHVLNPNPPPPPLHVDTDVTIPVLDDPISPAEVELQVKRMKVDKACGPDGLTPGVLTMLPAQWLIVITTLFNAVFMSGVYPVSWVRAMVFTIFKRGNRSDVNNYRGISVINSLAKLYDMILCNRLELWFRPFREQAGAQKKRGCIEHIVALRLLTDMARRKKLKLFVTFIDFSKAYDLVLRDKLFMILKRIGCGTVMLAALVSMYRVTESVIGGAVMTATLGVRQGSPTSCLLFIVFMNELIRMLKDGCAPDGFLGWLHSLVLMDDTVLLSTSREGMEHKLRLLLHYCEDYGMIINESKTKFFVIGGTPEDREPLRVGGICVNSCTSYVYLGSPFTSDGSVSSSVKLHAKSKTSHVLKFVSFVKKNNDVPFIVKRRVFDAALMSSLLYGCESWVGADLKPVIKLYNWALKQLLGVRKTTPNDVCYAEAGYPSLPDLVRWKQHKYISNVLSERSDLVDDPLTFAFEIAKRNNTSTSRTITEFRDTDVPDVSSLIDNVHTRITASSGSRCIVYRNLNPNFIVHSVYKERHTVNERYRIAFTRLRVSGHSLCIETGRWNRRGRGRLPVEERLCVCGEVQTERHVIESCPVSSNVRQRLGFSQIEELFNGQFMNNVSCKTVFDILNLYV